MLSKWNKAQLFLMVNSTIVAEGWKDEGGLGQIVEWTP